MRKNIRKPDQQNFGVGATKIWLVLKPEAHIFINV